MLTGLVKWVLALPYLGTPFLATYLTLFEEHWVTIIAMFPKQTHRRANSARRYFELSDEPSRALELPSQVLTLPQADGVALFYRKSRLEKVPNNEIMIEGNPVFLQIQLKDVVTNAVSHI